MYYQTLLHIKKKELCIRRGIILSEANPMSGVFWNIDPTPPHRPARLYPPRLWCGGRTHSLGGEGVGGSIVRKTPDNALYSIYVRTLCVYLTQEGWQLGRRYGKLYTSFTSIGFSFSYRKGKFCPGQFSKHLSLCVCVSRMGECVGGWGVYHCTYVYVGFCFSEVLKDLYLYTYSIYIQKYLTIYS